MARRKKNKKIIFFLVILIIFLGGIIILKKYFVNHEIELNNNKVSTNNKIFPSNKDNNKETKEVKINNVEEKGPKATEEEETQKEVDKNVSINIELIGEEEIIINKGDNYIDQGVKATDSDGKDLTDDIEIINNVDTSKAGNYSIIYSYGKNIVIRKIIVR